MAGFEPTTFRSQSGRATNLRHIPRSWTECTRGGGAATPRGERVACPRATGPIDPEAPRGRSSMAEPLPSKQMVRVRFPSPAPHRPRHARPRHRRPSLGGRRGRIPAASGTHGNEGRPCRADPRVRWGDAQSASTRPRSTARASRRGTATDRPRTRTGTRSVACIFHCERRERVLLRDILRLGTAMSTAALSRVSATGARHRAARGMSPYCATVRASWSNRRDVVSPRVSHGSGTRVATGETGT